MGLQVVILAAGKGTRMRSSLPKVLHPLAGVSLLERVVDVAKALEPESIYVVYGHQGDRIKKELAHLPVTWVEQGEQLGTGHALMQVMPYIDCPEDDLLILSADVPLIRAETLADFVRQSQTSPLALLLAKLDDPRGLGRIIRDDSGEVTGIIEEKDANALQKSIKEIYSGIMLVNTHLLHDLLPKLNKNNAQAEYYLTEIITLAAKASISISATVLENAYEIRGVNDRLQLQQLERIYQAQLAEELMRQGVTLTDANRIDIRGTLSCERDVFIDANVIFEGRVTLAEGCRIASGCVIKNSSIGVAVDIQANSVLDNCVIGDHSTIGPFARLRPNTILGANCKVGNFVEIKKSTIDEGSKISHLSYVGDALIGKDVNLGAGTITCNYDGVNKHQTIIEDSAFIGSDTQLVAPVRVGKNATIGAGSTIRKDAPAEQLTLNDTKQKVLSAWKRPQKIKKNTDLSNKKG